MSILIDTSVWSLSIRRHPPDLPEVTALRDALNGQDLVATTGVILQEVLQGLTTEAARTAVRDQMDGMNYLEADRNDHLTAADVFVGCRERGIQIGSIDALIAAICIRRDLTLLTTDRDFAHVAKRTGLRLWSA